MVTQSKEVGIIVPPASHGDARDMSADPGVGCRQVTSPHFEDKYFDDIRDNYFKPILDDVFAEHGQTIRLVGDVGCGNGLFTAWLKESHNITLYGFDGSEYALKLASMRRFDKLIRTPDLSSSTLQADDNSFDLIVNKDVLEHLLRPEHLLREIARILKPNALLLVSVANEFDLWKRIQFVFTNNIDTHNYFPSAREWNRPHIRFFTSGGLRELLGLCGFQVVKDYSWFFTHKLPIFHRVPGYMVVFRGLAKLYPSQFAQAITLLARKRNW